jgi:hypothetical protein
LTRLKFRCGRDVSSHAFKIRGRGGWLQKFSWGILIQLIFPRAFFLDS